MNAKKAAFSYDLAPYPDFVIPDTHPDRLATLSTLLGMNPAPVRRCRVLEIGCAAGMNLMAMASVLPHSTFTGVDLSAVQIEAGQTHRAALGLDNVTLHHMNFTDLPEDIGEFDYIIAHGVYSWVPPAEREALLAICRRLLAPQGIAYISYNTYPGWHLYDGIRHTLRYHTRRLTLPAYRLEAGVEFLNFLTEMVNRYEVMQPVFGEVYRRLLLKQRALLPERTPSVIVHEELGEFNTPLYFHEFMEHASTHHLQFVCEARFSLTSQLGSPTIQEAIQHYATSVVEAEQYLDFFYCRAFRSTLLAHDTVTLNRTITPERLFGLWLYTPATLRESEADDHTPLLELHGADNSLFRVSHPLTQAALRHLVAMKPQAVAFEELLAAARAQTGGALFEADSQEEQALFLATHLMQASTYSPHLLELHAFSPAPVSAPSEKPVAAAVARLQAARGQALSNLWHQPVTLDTVQKTLLQLLDGSRDSAALESLMASEAENAPNIPALLQSLAAAALLVG